MPDYQYVAKNTVGERVTGAIAAADEEQLYSILRNTNLYLISSKPVEEKTQKILRKGISRRELISFTTHLSTLLGAGVPINQGLQDIAALSEREWFQALVLELQRSIEMDGLSLSEAMARHPNIFSELYVNIVKAGETTGNVDQCLNDLVDFLEWQEKLAKDIRQATMYPAVILSAVLGLILVLLMFVFPKFLSVLTQMGASVQLPPLTRGIMAVSDFVKTRGLYVLGVLGLAVVAFRIAIRYPGGRLFWDRFKLSLPVIGDLIRKVALSRFSNYFGILIKAGVDVIQTMSIVENVVGNTVLARVIRDSRHRVMMGATISASLASSGEFPPLVVRMIHLGEGTGGIDTALKRVKDYYDREVSLGVARVFALLEPALFIILAVVVLGVALAMYLPLWDIIGKVGQTR